MNEKRLQGNGGCCTMADKTSCASHK
jgi:hypothetical protein